VYTCYTHTTHTQKPDENTEARVENRLGARYAFSDAVDQEEQEQ
jgi:hypothetical protein